MIPIFDNDRAGFVKRVRRDGFLDDKKYMMSCQIS